MNIDEMKDKIARAEESAKKFFGKPTDLVDLDNLRIFKNGYLASAEPRENQIQIDAEQIRALQKQNGELTDKVKELEAQIEKMQETLKSDLIARLKENISYSTSPSCTKGMELFIKSIEKWEIKEK